MKGKNNYLYSSSEYDVFPLQKMFFSSLKNSPFFVCIHSVDVSIKLLKNNSNNPLVSSRVTYWPNGPIQTKYVYKWMKSARTSTYWNIILCWNICLFVPYAVYQLVLRLSVSSFFTYPLIMNYASTRWFYYSTIHWVARLSRFTLSRIRIMKLCG